MKQKIKESTGPAKRNKGRRRLKNSIISLALAEEKPDESPHPKDSNENYAQNTSMKCSGGKSLPKDGAQNTNIKVRKGNSKFLRSGTGFR